MTSGQSNKHFTIVNNDSKVAGNDQKFAVSMTLPRLVSYDRRVFITFATTQQNSLSFK